LVSKKSTKNFLGVLFIFFKKEGVGGPLGFLLKWNGMGRIWGWEFKGRKKKNLLDVCVNLVIRQPTQFLIVLFYFYLGF